MMACMAEGNTYAWECMHVACYWTEMLELSELRMATYVYLTVGLGLIL